MFQAGTRYRATGVVLTDLVAASPVQPTLFDNPVKIVKTRRLYNAIDELREEFGKHVVHSVVTLPAQKTQHLTARGDMPMRKLVLLKGETKRRRLPLPMLQASAK